MAALPTVVLVVATSAAVEAAVTTPTATTKPHILHILLDDFGWAEIGMHRPGGYREVQTPVMDELVAAGVQLDRFCKSGWLPLHANRWP